MSNSSQYKVTCTFNTLIHEGSKRECEMIIKAFEVYGMQDKLILVEPISADFKLPAELRDKIYNDVHEAFLEGRNYNSYLADEVTNELEDYSDYDLLEAYEQAYPFEDESHEHDHGERGRSYYDSYLAEKELLK